MLNITLHKHTQNTISKTQPFYKQLEVKTNWPSFVMEKS